MVVVCLQSVIAWCCVGVSLTISPLTTFTSSQHQAPSSYEICGLTQSLPDWGGLVVGVKGDETEFPTELLSENRRLKHLVHLQVRPAHVSESWTPPHRFNLLSDRSLPWTAHAKAIVDTAASMTQGRQDAFFKPMAQLALANALHLLEQLGRPVTLVRAYHLLTSDRILKEALEEPPILRPL